MIAEILVEADGGCQSCASELMKLFLATFPQLKEIAHAAWKEKFDYVEGEDSFDGYVTKGKKA